jgi:hypothetical protein
MAEPTERARPATGTIGLLGLVGGVVALGIGGLDSVVLARYDKETVSIVAGLITTPTLLWAHVAWFLLAFGALHVAFALAVFLIPSPFLVWAARTPAEARRSHYLVALTAVLVVLLLNARIYPRSWFAHSLEPFAASSAGTGVIFVMLAGLVAVSALGAALGLRRTGPKGAVPAVVLAALVGLSLAWGGRTASGEPSLRAAAPAPGSPNVILVGIDGWRLDAAPRTGGTPGDMPFLDSLMATAAVLQESYTPHARTYPAWMTILSGRDPVDHGARFNLIGDEHLDLGTTLVEQLRRRGYHAVFAMDERRFANIGYRHGFDQVVAPPMGAADFLLGRWNDTPLTNLVSPLPAARWLFPHTHANRAAAATYRPGAFDAQIARAVRRAPEGPLLLAVHYELPHWPYYWGEPPSRHFEDDPVRGPGSYFQTLARTDEQLRTLFRVLEARGVLDHAIVVILSDHGEVFSSGGVESWASEEGRPAITGSPGHGTDLLSLDQFRVPLAFLRLDGTPLPASVLPIRGSLADIYPTLAEWLNLAPPEGGSGISLAGELLHPTRASWERAITLETGFSLPSLLDADLDERRLLDEGARFYHLTPRGRLVLREETLGSLMAAKQRAVLWDDRILVARPGLDPGAEVGFVLAHLSRRSYRRASGAVPPAGFPVAGLERWCEAFHRELESHTVAWCVPDRIEEAGSGYR